MKTAEDGFVLILGKERIFILYTSKSYFLRQLPYENAIQYPCKAVKAPSNRGKNSPPQFFNGKFCY